MYAPRIIRRRFHWPTAIAMLCVFASLAVITTGIVVATFNRSPIPDHIRKQVKFSIFLPTKGVLLIQSSYEYKSIDQVLLFSGKLTDGQKVTFSEQQTPTAFNDIPNYTTQFMQAFFEYQTFDSLQGTVHLTHPKGGGQVAIMNSKGTIMFVKVAHDEPQSTWQQLFNHLSVYTP